MTDRDDTRLRLLHPELSSRLARVLVALEGLGWPMTITDGLRTAAEQAELHKQGRTIPGPNVRPGHPLGDTVTGADGVTGLSKHQSGRAADCAFLDRVTGRATWSEAYPWRLYGEACKAAGLLWGGDMWKSRVDRPHAELPTEIP